MTERARPPDHPVVELFRDLRQELDRMGVDAVHSLRPSRARFAACCARP